MKRIVFTLAILLVAALSIYAQESYYMSGYFTDFEKGKDCFLQQNYTASNLYLKRYVATHKNSTDAIVQEAQYYIAANAYYLKDKNALKILEEYVKKYPTHPMTIRVKYYIGRLKYEKKEWEEVIKYYKPLNVKHLDDNMLDDYTFALGHSYFMCKQYSAANRILSSATAPHNKYAQDALYYSSYAQFAQKDYQSALTGFQNIPSSSKYYAQTQYHILQIYDQLGMRKQAVELGEKLLKEYPQSPSNTECYRILGENSYFEKDWEKALTYLQRYADKEPQVQRADMYMLGIANYLTNKYPAAISALGKVTIEQDSLSQNAYIFIGHSYLQQNNPSAAAMAFRSAADINADAKLQEEALYNYAISTYESNAPFGESITAFDRFITQYPNSKHISDIYAHKADAYLSDKNYAKAIESISMVEKITPKLKQAKEQALFKLGVEEFNNKSYENAISYFTQSIAENNASSFSSQAYLWRAESYYRLDKTDLALKDFQAFIDAPQGKTADQLQKSYFSMGYIKFNAKQYTAALPYFKTFLKVSGATRSPYYADVLNRMGDCYYHGRDFENARATYKKVPSKAPSADYAAFQSASILGLQKDYAGKITELTKMAKNYPLSDYLDDALYQIGRTYILQNDYSSAITAYRNLQTRCPNSALSRAATLEIGMIYANMGQTDNAIKAYKYVIDKYPSCQETQVALESMQSLYIADNRVDEYLAYREQIAGSTISTVPKSKEDTITFLAAEGVYAKGNYQEAITSFDKYITKYCEARTINCISAEYYLADSYYQLGQKQNALKYYDHLTSLDGNEYMEISLLRGAEITYDMKNYNAALDYFTLLGDAASNNENRTAAHLGKLRCNSALGRDNGVIEAATELINNPASSEELLRESKYLRMKSYLALSQADKAVDDMKELSGNIAYEMGAEAAYLYAQYKHDIGEYDNAEELIMNFINTGTPHQYWMARQFVLLSDIYAAKSDDFMARQYLLSLKENYSADDDINDLIEERLNAIMERESSKILK